MIPDFVRRVVGQAGRSIRTGLMPLVSNAAVTRITSYVLHFLLGLTMSRAVIFGGYAPFGVGIVGAFGNGTGSVCALAGALVGYFLPGGVHNSFKYAGAAILICAACFVFKSLDAMKLDFFMPAVSAISFACVGFVFVATSPIGLYEITMFVTEIILVGGSAYFYKMALSPSTKKGEGARRSLKQQASSLILLSTMVIALANVTVYAGISIGRTLAVLAVMVAALKGGIGSGSAVGIVVGLSMDIALGKPMFGLTYGFAGMMAGILSNAGRLLSVLTFVVSGALVVFSTGQSQVQMPALYETFIASVIFMVLPESFFAWVSNLLGIKINSAGDYPERLREYARDRLGLVSGAFRELYNMLASTFDKTSRTNDADITTVFDRTSGRVCRKCALMNICWERESETSFSALNEVSPIMMKKCRVEADDFPQYFSSRCLNFPKFLNVANEELTALIHRRQFNNRLRESREMVCSQYSEMSNILETVAEELTQDITFDTAAEERIQKFLKPMGVNAKVTVRVGSDGHKRAEVDGTDLTPMHRERSKVRHGIANALGAETGEPEIMRMKSMERWIFTEVETYTAIIGVAANKKQGQKVSGDSGTYFKDESGTLNIILSDGMGSGREAAHESATAVRMLERMLRSGIRADVALKLLNSALILRGAGDGGYATIDLLSASLQKGDSVLYKFGAAPTYIKRGKKVSRITCSALPAGVETVIPPVLDMTKFKLVAGDIVVMTSDGVADHQNDGWLMEEIAEYVGDSPKELATKLLGQAEKLYSRGDDMTVVALYIETTA